MSTEQLVIAGVVVFLGLGFYGAPIWLWTLAAAGILYGFEPQTIAWIIFGVTAAILNLPPLRILVFTGPAFKVMKALKLIPQISPTEAIALKAGDVWIEKELFSGKPNFKRLMEQSYPELTPEEKAFMDGPVNQLCKMIDDFSIWRSREIPKPVMDFIKKEKFFGMIIPREYGGLGFSALANSEVIHILASRSMPVAVTVMVPNSLGPAELLVHYGTDEQKKRLLPRLAIGEEVPCFALTEPHAGSDAASIQSTGVVFKKDGQLFMRMNWDKRWITLAAESTLLGMAFRLKDPENLLGKGVEDMGITCALIPRNTPGITADKRHDPMYCPFVNSPTQGKDVVVPIDAIIGGVKGAGIGWEMLMESLGAGRGISLPAQSAGGIKLSARVASAHATVRKQFGMSTGRFEGVAEAIGKIGGFAYLMEASRRYTVGALDSGTKPPVVTAIMKHYATEISRTVINLAMDVVAGSGVVVGPRNLLAHSYISAPISITVEGANILTRTLIIFGQGAIRAHPFAYLEMEALETGDYKKFDRAFTGHLGHVFRNLIRWNLLSLTRGWLAYPGFSATARYKRKLAWTSATFAFLADFYMGSLGGKLKAKGKITGRMADILGWMYLATATLKRYEFEQKKEDTVFLRWAMDHAFCEIQKALDGLFGATETPFIGKVFAWPVRWLHALNPVGRPPSDKDELEIARLIQIPGEQRERISGRIFVPKTPGDRLYDMERAFELVYRCEDADRKIKRAVRKKLLKKKPAKELLPDALAAKVITQTEFDDLVKVEEIRNQVIQVDSYTQEEYFGHLPKSSSAAPRASTMGLA